MLRITLFAIPLNCPNHRNLTDRSTFIVLILVPRLPTYISFIGFDNTLQKLGLLALHSLTDFLLDIVG